ncbi:MAG: SPFH domain-containing protein [Planctomycetota bacterium]
MDHPRHNHGQPAARMPEPQAPPADPAHESLVRALRSSFTILRLIMILLLVGYVASGIFIINPGQQGLIARLGVLVENDDDNTMIFKPGWRPAWPDPIDEKITISGAIFKLETDSFLFRRSPKDIADKTDIATIRRPSSSLTPGTDGAMLTGDKNLSHGLWEVEYRIDDGARFVRTVGEQPRDVEPLLKRLFENSILREVAYRRVEDVTRGLADEVAKDVARRLQSELDELQVGLTVVKVQSSNIVPSQVAPAFTEVTRAENEKQQQEYAAGQRANAILNQAAGPQHAELLALIRDYGDAQLADRDAEVLARLRQSIDDKLEEAQGEVAVQLREAQAESDTVREQINREYEEFTYWLEQYRLYPGPTLVGLWAQMRQEVLGSNDNELFWVPDSQVIEILINRDPNKAIDAERDRLKKQVQPDLGRPDARM